LHIRIIIIRKWKLNYLPEITKELFDINQIKFIKIKDIIRERRLRAVRQGKFIFNDTRKPQ